MWHKGVRLHRVESKHPGRWGIVEHQIPSIEMLFKTNTKGHKHPSIGLLSKSKTQLVNQRKQKVSLSWLHVCDQYAFLVIFPAHGSVRQLYVVVSRNIWCKWTKTILANRNDPPQRSFKLFFTTPKKEQMISYKNKQGCWCWIFDFSFLYRVVCYEYFKTMIKLSYWKYPKYHLTHCSCI